MGKGDPEHVSEPSQQSIARRAQVSAIMVSYFTGPLLARALDALRAQPDVKEIILVDNGNWDGAVKEAIGENDSAPPVRLLSGHGNIGFAAACNLAAASATGDVLLFVNPDAILPRGAVADLLLGGQAEDGPWVIAPKIIDPDGAEQQGSRRATLTPWRAFVETTKLYHIAPKHPYFRRFNLHGDPCPERRTRVPVISGACFMLPKTDYDAIGGMDERYFLHVEDVDFCLRFAKAGGRVLFEPAVAVLHFKSSSRVGPISVEARKTASIIKYFYAHFSNVYPVGFLPLVGVCLWGLFAVKIVGRTAADALGFVGVNRHRGAAVLRRARAIASRRASR